jgi:lipid-binding SYLF domain-containing protein
MKRLVAFLAAAALLSPSAFAKDKDDERLENAGTVLKEILDIPDNVPQGLLDKAECIVVLPSVKKFALGFGGSYGKGFMTCRSGEKFDGPWSAPAAYRLEGASFGFQLGGSGTDFLLLVMNPKGAESLLKSKAKLGADATAAAGPKGRESTAETDVAMNAEVLSYSRAKGLFAGVSLEGSTLRPDDDVDKKLYGKDVTAIEIVREGKVPPPASAQVLLDTLNKKAPKNLSDAKKK